MNIYEKMAKITAELQTVAKNLSVETGKGKGYKAVAERDILDAVKPLETLHGIYSFPISREVLESQTLESESEYNGKITKRTTFFSRIRTVYRFVNIEQPEEYIDTVTIAEGIDSQDKGSGKAMTYADKYALMKAYKISTGDDPDQSASTDVHYSKHTEPEYISEEVANRIISGLSYIAGDDVEAQRKILKEVCGQNNVYQIKANDGPAVLGRLRDMARNTQAVEINEDNSGQS